MGLRMVFFYGVRGSCSDGVLQVGFLRGFLAYRLLWFGC